MKVMARPQQLPLGPHSVLGRLAADPRIGFTGFSLGVLQLMHPAVSAGVIDHSDFFNDPFDRIYRSLPRIIASITAPDSAERTRRIRDYHREIKGTDANGRRYHALDPDVFWWTHMTFVWGFLLAADRFHHRPPRGEERQRYYAESVEWWRRYGLSMRPVAPDLNSFLAEFEDVCAHQLEWTPAADRAMKVNRLEVAMLPSFASRLVSIPGTPLARLTLVGGLPSVVRERFDIPWGWPQEQAYRTFARSVRNAGRAVPDGLARYTNTLMLKRMGASTQLASA
jgi:uncharacterized protein (DUF2236 family)